MSRPLLISDCDKVLLHIVATPTGWGRRQDRLHHRDVGTRQVDEAAERRRAADAEMFGFLGGFFPAEMARQTLVPAPGKHWHGSARSRTSSSSPTCRTIARRIV
ncbi:hypothetical protein AB5I41_20430 [Sphingomonas sp. MMS24-JH45]